MLMFSACTAVCVCRVVAAPWHNWPWLTVPAFPAPQPCHRRCRCFRIRAPPCSALSLWRWVTAQTRQQARCARTDQTGNHCLRAARPLVSVHCGVAGSLPLWRLSVSVRSAHPLPVCKYCWLRTRVWLAISFCCSIVVDALRSAFVYRRADCKVGSLRLAAWDCGMLQRGLACGWNAVLESWSEACLLSCARVLFRVCQ